jgi:hypothetical protein
MGFGVKPPPLVEISLDYISSTIVADAPLPFFSRGWLHAAPCSRRRRPSCTANSQRLPLLRPLKRHKWPRGGRALMVHGIGAGGGQSQPSLLEEDEDGWPAAPHRLRVGAWSLFLRATAYHRRGGIGGERQLSWVGGDASAVEADAIVTNCKTLYTEDKHHVVCLECLLLLDSVLA